MAALDKDKVGSSAQTAEAKKKKAQARRMAARMAPSRRSRGSTALEAAGRRQATSAPSSTRKDRALGAKAAAGPAAVRDEAAERRAKRAGKVEADAVQCNGADQVLARH
jgi:hypothetical protein